MFPIFGNNLMENGNEYAMKSYFIMQMTLAKNVRLHFYLILVL